MDNVRPDDNLGPKSLAVCGTLVGNALATIVVRIWVRAAIIKHLGWDDYAMVLAMAVMFAEMMVIIPQVQLGGGRHVEYIDSPSNVTKGLRLNFVTQPLCLIGLLLTKISVGLFLLRIMLSKRYRYCIWGVMIFTFCSSLGNICTVFFQCRPLTFTWDITIPGGSCIAPDKLKFAAYFNSSVAVVTDFTFALLPIPMLWQVQLNRKYKIAVAGILSLGIFASVAAIVKITFLKNYGKHGDFLYDSADLSIWTTVEICCAIAAANIPCLKSLFRTFLGGSSARYAYKGKEGSNEINNGVEFEPKTSRFHGHSGTARPIHRGPNNDDFGMDSDFSACVNESTESRAGSEESIVRRRNEDSIIKTTEIMITVDDQRTA